MKIVPVPIEYATDPKARGSFGKFRYAEHHVLSMNGQQTVAEDMIPDSEVKQGTIYLPERIIGNLGGLATELAKGADQNGIYTGRKVVVNNCARFIHDLIGIEFDTKMLENHNLYGDWLTELKSNPNDEPGTVPTADPLYVPKVGEVAIYKHRSSPAWSHWAMGIDGDLQGVIGLGGPNGHGLSIAASNDVAKSLGFNIPQSATHPQYSHLQ